MNEKKLKFFLKKKKIIFDGLHIDLKSNLANTFYEVCTYLEKGVKSITVDLTEFPMDLEETMFLSLRSLARLYNTQLLAKGSSNLAKYNQLVEADAIYDYTDYIEDLIKNSCDINIINREVHCEAYMAGLINLPRIESIVELAEVVVCAEQLLLCKLNSFDYPACSYSGRFSTALGLNGLHEWCLQRDYPYSMSLELEHWLDVYKEASESSEVADLLEENKWPAPNKIRGIFPNSYKDTTEGIETIHDLDIAKRLVSRGVSKLDVAANYSVSDQLAVLEGVSEYIDGFIRSQIVVSGESIADNATPSINTNLKELSINFI